MDIIIANYYIKKATNKLNSNSSLVKIAVTGSYGKTSTKQILSSILNEEFLTLATPKSYNTPLGISKCINVDLDNSHEVFVCEMGAKKVGEINYLCNFVKPEYGVVTSVGRQHTNTFGSIYNIYKTKSELPNYYTCKNCVFNLMNEYVFNMFDKFNGSKIGVYVCTKHNTIKQSIIKSLFQYNKSSDNLCGIYYQYPRKNILCAKRVLCNCEGSIFDVYYDNKFFINLRTSLLGVHNIINILLSLGIAIMLNIKKQNIIKGLSTIKSINARMEKSVNLNGAVVINNGYNSNVDSVDYSLKTLSLFNSKHKVIITPGIIDSENDYEYNVIFGSKIALYCTEIIIVKNTNKDALTEGVIRSGFDKDKIYYVDKFNEVKDFLNKADSSYVILIENDLPDNFK